MPFKDKAAKRAYDRKYYHTKVDKTVKIKGKKTRRAKLREFVQYYLSSHPCVDCGETDPVVLDFDHQGNKELEIANTISRGWSIERIAKEMMKCQVRCANCHRRKTTKDRNSRV